MKFSIVVLVLAAFGVVANPTPTDSSSDALSGPARRLFPDVEPLPLPTGASEEVLTNAERLRRGLLPKAPIARAPSLVLRSQSSPAPHSGLVSVHLPGNSGPVYLSNRVNRWGYFTLTKHKSQALSVSFSSTHTSKPFSLKIDNPQFPKLPYVGGILGHDSSSTDLKTKNGAYAALGVTVSTPPGSSPQKVSNGFTSASKHKVGVESAIWTFDSHSRSLTPTWINSNGKPASQQSVVYVESDQFLVITSNPTQFARDYGTKVLRQVTFTLV